MKRIISFILCAVSILTMASCGGEPAVIPTETTPPAADDIFIVDRYLFDNTAEFPLPEGAVLRDSDPSGPLTYVADDASALDTYLDAARGQGYTVEQMTYFTLLYRGDRYIFLSTISGLSDGSTPAVYMECFCGHETPSDGLSPEQARDIIDPDSELLPIDVSPQGLFENTGGQIFMLPIYSLDYWRRNYGIDDVSDIDIPENRLYYECYSYVSGGRAITLDMPDLAFADIDGDGEREMLVLGYGPTSGLFTFTVTAYRGGERVAGCIYQSDYYNLSFEKADGAVRVKGVPQDDGAAAYFDISLSGDTVTLNDDSGTLRQWGSIEQLGTEAG